MEELIRTNDLVIISFVDALLKEADIDYFVADQAMSALEGMDGAFPRRVLIDARAAQSDAADIRSSITVDAGTQSMNRPETSPIVAAVKKLTAKE